jgi:hypothetical protein
MIERAPPKLALWLLKEWGSRYHAESLAGDLIEQHHEGRSGAWVWKQVIAAIWVARSRNLRTPPWAAAGRILARLLAETAAVLALVVLIDRARRTQSPAELTDHVFISVLAGLITVAFIGFFASIRPGKRKRGHAVINTLLLVFGVIALGAGTLTWADTTRRDACQSPACVCSND